MKKMDVIKENSVKSFPYRIKAVILLGKENRTRWGRAITLLMLIPVLFLGDRMLGGFLSFLNDESGFRYSRLYAGKAGADIVFIGDSRGHAFYEPYIEKVTGKKVVNLSYNALPMALGRAILEDYLDRYSPEQIVMEVHMLRKTEDNVITGFKMFRDKSDRIRKLIKQTSGETDIACTVSSLYKFNSEIFHRSLFYLGKKDNNWILDKKINKSLIENTHMIDSVTYQFPGNSLEELKALIKVAEKKNVKVSLVLAPIYPAYVDRITNLGEFIRTIEKSTGYKVYDYSSVIPDTSFYSDYLHINKKGSKYYIGKMRADKIF